MLSIESSIQKTAARAKPLSVAEARQCQLCYERFDAKQRLPIPFASEAYRRWWWICVACYEARLRAQAEERDADRPGA